MKQRLRRARAAIARLLVRPPPSGLNLLDVEAVEGVLRKRDPSVLASSVAEAEVSVGGAARWVLALLRSDRQMRRRFPRALSDGVKGGFCQWLRETGWRECGLPARAIENVMAAFEQGPGSRVWRVYLHVPGVQKSHPLDFSPPHGEGFVKWLLKQGRAQYGFAAKDVLWFLQQAAEDPWPLLVGHYLVCPDWQRRFPCALTAVGMARWIRWLKRENGVVNLPDPSGAICLRPADQLHVLFAHCEELRRSAPDAFSRPEDTDRLVAHAGRRLSRTARLQWERELARDRAAGLMDRPGVNVMGHFCYPSGLSRAASGAAHALEQAGLRVSRRDVPAGLRPDTRDRSGHLGLELFDVSLWIVPPFDPLAKLYQQSGLAFAPEVHHIGMWYWELDQLPEEWIERAKSMDELWAPSRFIADAMRRVVQVPVFTMPQGVYVPSAPCLPRSHFGIRGEGFTFLFAFDMGSVMERKNPLGLIRAFRKAFSVDEPVSLVVKVSRGASCPADMERLVQAAADARVTLIDRVLPDAEIHALLAACDAYVSLHRSEGFGLPLAEAMLLGKPVIATNYSGNLDFMSEDNSLLVDCELVPIREGLPFYGKDNRWAEPSITDAAAKMRWVVEHPVEARALGERARAQSTELLCQAAAGHRMAGRIHQIRAAKRGRGKSRASCG